MKTAISLSDKLFKEADRYARKKGLSRSKLCALALAEYLRKRNGDFITKALNDVYSVENGHLDPGLDAAQFESLIHAKW